MPGNDQTPQPAASCSVPAPTGPAQTNRRHSALLLMLVLAGIFLFCGLLLAGGAVGWALYSREPESAAAHPTVKVTPPLSSSALSALGDGLSPQQVQAVVQANVAELKRRCWDPVIAREPGRESVRVTATLTIHRDGTVDEVSLGRGDPVPGLKSCMSEVLRGWRFPGSDGPSVVHVPLVFAAD